MLKLTFCNIYDNTLGIKFLADIDYENGSSISEFTITKRAKNEAMQARFVFTPEFPYFQEILEKPYLYGIRVQHDKFDSCFSFKNGDGRLTSDGEASFSMISTCQTLRDKRSLTFFSYTDQTLASLLALLDTDRFVFTPTSTDSANRNVPLLQTGEKNDYEIMTEIIGDRQNMDWRDNGIISSGGRNKTQILYGDFSNEMDGYATISGDPKSDPAFSLQSNSDLLDNKDTVQISKVTTHFDFNFANRLYVFGDTGSGASNNSLVKLDPQFITQNPRYPLVFDNVKKEYYILNTVAPQQPVFEETKRFQTSVNSEDATGVIVVDIPSMTRWLYQKGINYLSTQIVPSYNSIREEGIKELLMPGNNLKIDYKNVFKLENGNKITLQEFKDNVQLDDLEEVNIFELKN